MSPFYARRLASCRPDLAAAFLEVSQDFARQFPGCHMGVAQGYRDADAQAVAFATGRSPADGKTSFSLHQLYPSPALDFLVLDENGRYVADGTDSRYAWAGDQFEKHGCKWGGRFVHAPKDWDHVELVGAAVDATAAALSSGAYARVAYSAPFLTV